MRPVAMKSKSAVSFLREALVSVVQQSHCLQPLKRKS
jgi:hypothetical protein